MRASERLAEIKYLQNKKKLIEAYELYRADPQFNESLLLDAVMAFAKVKLYFLEVEFSSVGSANTVDDFAQEVVITVWSKIGQFQGDADNFYAWLHRICHNKGTKFFNELRSERDNKEPVTTMVSAEYYVAHNHAKMVEEEIDNPLLHQEQERDFFITIPNSIQGVDREICKLLVRKVQVDGNGDEDRPKGRRRDTVNYAEVGRILGLSANAVKMRLRQLRKRMEEERKEKKNKPARPTAA